MTRYKYQPFINFARKHGISLNNTFEIEYNFNSTNGIESALKTVELLGTSNYEDHLSFFVEEVDMPGVFLSTGEYRYNNSPQFKYPYAKTFNKFTITYLLDRTLIQRRFYDIWLDYIYNLSGNRLYNYNASRTEFGNVSSTLNRVPYKNDYTCNITIKKYDRPVNCDETINFSNSSIEEEHYKPKYSVTMVNAFPTDITPIALSNAASDVTRFSVSFEYDIMRDSASYGGSSFNLSNSNILNPFRSI